MWIFKKITDFYCNKILETYRTQADEKMYQGKEAELLVQRNEFARCLVESIQKIEIAPENTNDSYFTQILEIINTSSKDVAEVVQEHNNQHRTQFTADLYQSFFAPGLLTMISVLQNLFQSSPPNLANLMDDSLFKDNKNVPWIYQFASVIYYYIIEKEYELMINKSDRDIFDGKKSLGIKYVTSVTELYSHYKDENDNDYKTLMASLLKGMSAEENDLQQRKSSAENASGYTFFTFSLYQTTKQMLVKSQLGLIIEKLITEFSERSLLNQPIATMSTIY